MSIAAVTGAASAAATTVAGAAAVADIAASSFVSLLAQQPHETALTVPVAAQLNGAALEKNSLAGLSGMISERLELSLDDEVTEAYDAGGEGRAAEVVRQKVQDLFNGGPNQTRLVLRAIAGSVWATESLRERDDDYREDPRIHLLGFPGERGEKVGQLLERRKVGVLPHEKLVSLLLEDSQKESLNLGLGEGGVAGLWDSWRRRKALRLMKRALWAELMECNREARHIWSDAAKELERAGSKRDAVLRAALSLRAGRDLKSAAQLFLENDYPEHAALAWFRGTLNAASTAEQAEDFVNVAGIKAEGLENMEYRARQLVNRVGKIGEGYELRNWELPTAIQTMMALYRFALEVKPLGKEGAVLFAEAQEAFGRRLSRGAVLGEASSTARIESGDIDWSFGFFLGARHLFEAASVYALHDVHSGRHDGDVSGVEADAEWALQAALYAMEGKGYLWTVDRIG